MRYTTFKDLFITQAINVEFVYTKLDHGWHVVAYLSHPTNSSRRVELYTAVDDTSSSLDEMVATHRNALCTTLESIICTISVGEK